MSKTFDLYGFQEWLLERQRHHEQLAKSETTNQVLMLAHETRALVFHMVRAETDRFIEESPD